MELLNFLKQIPFPVLLVAVDGDFGKNTKTALKTFQKNVGIDDDGCCGQNTWKKIADHMNANTFK